MEKTIIKKYCDICGTETENMKKDYTVIFITEQTEGRDCKPYFDGYSLNICDECLDKMLIDGKQIFAYGAQGCNTYYFKEGDK